MTVCIPISVINDAVVAVAGELPIRLRTVTPWTEKSEHEIWRELVAAILGSAVSYESVISALGILDMQGFTVPTRDLSQRSDEIACSLKYAGYRFPKLRARQVAGSAAAIYRGSNTLASLLETYTDALAARRALVEMCPGLGPKQASLFLRNIGYDELAILDRHVLAYLQQLGMLKGTLQSVQSVKKYEELEQVVLNVASCLGLSIAEFDLAVWVTWRTAAGVNRQWQS